ncbi:MAG TPA: NAD(P)H-hydrate dehydratase [Rhizomicrobium sp.]|nr:NAD(P)H-hydrate dehydratase [Rhizomicrobium sp.]
MSHEILSVAQSYESDRIAAARGVPALTLMENAGRAVADAVSARYPGGDVAVLCGPGNNGGDGFVAARLLAARGRTVRLFLLGDRAALKGDAAAMAAQWTGAVDALSPAALPGAGVVIDALFGAGLSRPLEGAAKAVVEALGASRIPVVAVDVPSGIQGDTGRAPGGVCVAADATVTFFRKKPAHVLLPGRERCGTVIVADIGIPPEAAHGATLFENTPDLWRDRFPWPRISGHKYSRGHCVCVSGPAHATGAARLAARGALRAGAGLVSVASPHDAVAVNAANLTAIMVKPFAGARGLSGLLADRRLNAVVIGPGCGTGRPTQELAAAVLASPAAAVLDADALTAFQDEPTALFAQLRDAAVLTPHEGEFERIFPGLLAKAENKVEAARAAAAAAHCTVLLKGADTVIAAADGRAAVNTDAPAWLATAGAGDVLAGIIGGLLAQGMESFAAAAAGAWLHGEAASRFGIGLIAEDIPETLPQVLRALHGGQRPAP